MGQEQSVVNPFDTNAGGSADAATGTAPGPTSGSSAAQPDTGSSEDTGNVATLNTPEVRRAIHADFQRIQQLEAERKNIGMDLSEIWKGFKERGIDVKAAKQAYKIYQQDKESRQEWAMGLDICLQATDCLDDIAGLLRASLEER